MIETIEVASLEFEQLRAMAGEGLDSADSACSDSLRWKGF